MTVHRLKTELGAGVRFLLEADPADRERFYAHPATLSGVVAAAHDRARRPLPAAASLVADRPCIVTGHQACFAGGPLMIVWKALTAVALARAASEQLGETVTPVFWAATEDHDLDEIRVVRILDRKGNLRRHSAVFAGEESSTPAQDAQLGSEARELLVGLIAELPEGVGRAAVVADLESTYGTEATAGAAFVSLLRRWFGRFGLVVVEPRDVAAQDSVPLQLEAADPAAGRLAREVGALLAAAGSVAPLDPAPGSQLYRIVAGQRIRLEAGETFAPGDQPSAAAALRPVWQDHALPVLAYVGGPSEVAYYGQLLPAHEHFDAPFPVVWPRASGTLVRPATRAVLDRLQVPPQETLTADLEALVPPGAAVPDEVRQPLQSLEDELARCFDAVTTALGAAPNLDKPLRKTRGSMEHNLTKLQGNLERHYAEQAGVPERDRRRSLEALRPEGAPQERGLSPLSFLAERGPQLFDEMLAAIDLEGHDHILLGWPP